LWGSKTKNRGPGGKINLKKRRRAKTGKCRRKEKKEGRNKGKKRKWEIKV
jgi:hypothetical protein